MGLCKACEKAYPGVTYHPWTHCHHDETGYGAGPEKENNNDSCLVCLGADMHTFVAFKTGTAVDLWHIATPCAFCPACGRKLK